MALVLFTFAEQGESSLNNPIVVMHPDEKGSRQRHPNKMKTDQLPLFR